ncbi:hypothetical protein DRO29_02520 [Candidatus Bathyarchaeota archaeon]|nr:MAG: hypothetical protein B6U84_02375 [Candidatus Bathyarchaeota archaeon ex4484_40]RLG97723.1 MAG: hypothetical protein DRO29_02520 [Candidatus Bathyarchaeota archaeon]
MKMMDLVFRAWYYFRIGYSTYLAFAVAFMSYITVIYKLAIEDLALSWVFPRFYTFIIFSLVTIIPLGVLIGWFHFKRTLAYSAAMAINVESNPYNYMITPGKETEIIWPMHMLYLTALQKLLEKENMLSPEEKKSFEEVLTKIKKLREGHVIGTPRHRQLLAKLKKAK